METERDVLENAPEEQIAYAASDVFSIVSPYVFHTHAPRVFSEISEALRRAQEASADVVARLEASKRAQEQERSLRACEARQYVARLRELQALMKARVEREIAGAKSRKSLKRKLREETSRSAQLERRLTDSEEELQRLRQEFDTEKCASEERWRSTLEQAVTAARKAERAKASGKVEALTVKRMRSLSLEVAELKEKHESLQVENANLLATLRSRPPRRPAATSSFERRAEKELCRLSAATAAEESESGRASSGSAGTSSGRHDGPGLADIVSGLADRIRSSFSERASDARSPRRFTGRRFYSDEEDHGGIDDGDYGSADYASAGLSPSLPLPEPMWQRRMQREQQQAWAAQRRERGSATATGEEKPRAKRDSYRSANGEVDVPRIGAAAAAAAAAAEAAAAAGDSARPSLGREDTRRGSSSSSSSSSSRRRGLASLGSLYLDAADAVGSSVHNPARGWVASEDGGDTVPAKPTPGVETLKGSSRRKHQRPLGGGGGGETVAGSNAPSLHALLASGEFYPAGRDIAARRASTGNSSRYTGNKGLTGLEGRRAAGKRSDRRDDQNMRELKDGPGGRDSAVAAAVTTTANDEGKQVPSARLHRTLSSFRWSGGRGTVELRDHNNISSRFAESGEGWVTGDNPGAVNESDNSRVEKDEDEQEEEEEEEGGRAWVEAAAREDVAGMTPTRVGREDDAGGVAAGIARAEEAYLAQDNNDDDGLTTAKDVAARQGDAVGVFSQCVGQKIGRSRSARAADTCGGGVHGTCRDSAPPRGTLLESAAARSEGSLLCSTFSAGVGGGADASGKGRGDGKNGKLLDDLFPPTTGSSARVVGVVTGEDGGKQRPALDDLLREMAVAMPVEVPGEGDNAGGSDVAPLSHRRADFMGAVLA